MRNISDDVTIVSVDNEEIQCNKYILSIFCPTLTHLISTSSTFFLPESSTFSIKYLLILITNGFAVTEKLSNEDLSQTKIKLKTENENIRNLISSQKNDEAINELNNFENSIEKYADSYSQNQNIKKESVKRKERINIIEKEIESWKNLLSNSEKMVNDLL